jgi:oligoendopeptidase F
MKKKMIGMYLSMAILFAALQLTFAQDDRTEIADQYKWDLSGIFKSDEDWQMAKKEVVALLPQIDQYKGTLTKSAADLLACLEFSMDVRKKAVSLFIYAGMNSDLNTRDMKYSGMKQELQQLFANYSARAAYINPEILSADWEVIEGFVKEEPGLKIYEKGLKDLFLLKKHTLSESEERILALSNTITGDAGSIYSTFKNAEMPNPEVSLTNGEKVVLSSAGYEKYRASANRSDREIVFQAFWENIAKYQATFGEMLYGNIKSDLYQAKARHYESSLEASLKPNNIPTTVYHALVENVNKNLAAFHRYLAIKQRMLQVDTLRYIDLYAPVVKGIDLKYSYDEAKEIILESLKPLGKEYVNVVTRAYDERWIDVYPTKGKRSGAYSNGAHYDGHPYILLNYNGLYSDVSTTTHELGHTMHSYYSNKNQPYPLADYTTFVAEVASTFNEVLLFEHIMKEVKDDEVRLSLLMDRLNGFKGTLFRQTQFAEFELRMHETAQKGMPLTGAKLSELYEDITRKYYGHDEGVCKVDDYISMEWAFIPHFYYNFYVYQYSTSFTASNYLARQVLDKKKGALEKYLNFLGAGASDDPIALLQKAGVDMIGSEAFDATIHSMNEVMDEIEKILDKKGL